MKIIISAVLALFLSAGPLFAAETTRYIVGFLPETDAAQQESILDRHGMRAVEDLEAFGAKIVEQESSGFRANAVGMMMAEPGVFYVEEDFYLDDWLVNAAPAFSQVPLPRLSDIMTQLPKLETKNASTGEQPWGIVRVNAKGAWPRTKGAGVKVAVVDTGIDFNHPDLKANYAGGYNALDSDKEPLDDHGHGTHVAGTIAAALDAKGVVGIAPEARLYAVKVLDKDGGGRLTSIIKGLVWCANNDIDVANMSLGSPIGTVFMRLAVKYAKARGVSVIAAAGNSGKAVSYPAAYPDAVAVSASDSKDKLAYFSCRGPEVEFVAPGVDVLSTVKGGKYARYSGTSMASPHVAGLAALAVSLGADGVDGVRASLRRAAKKVEGLTAEQQGAGMIDAALIR